MLVVSGADFSENGVPFVDPDEAKLLKIKAAIEAVYVQHKYYSTSYVPAKPSNNGNNRNAFGRLVADDIDSVAFTITPKTGCKIAPIQANGETSSSSHRWSIKWRTTSVTFNNFDTYQYMGCNVAYSDDSDIASGTSIWDFIDIELAE